MSKLTEREISAKAFKYFGGNENMRIFRNNIGVATIGNVLNIDGGMAIIENPRTVRFGLHVGSGDYIGWETVVITPEMVGAKIARFLSIEIKTDSGRLSPEQINWLDNVNGSGGRAFVYRG